MPDDALVTAQAQSTLTALTAEAQTAAAPEATEESPMVEPTTPPPTDIPPTDIPPTAVPPTAAPVPTTSPSSGATTTTYTVRRGDTLYSIARRYGTTVEAIAAANGIANPSRIRVGQVLKISGGTGVPAPPSGGSTYVVRRGDNLFRISLRYGISYVYLAQYNVIADPSRIYVGQVLRIPPR
jgi:LysM repeat protein